MLTLVIMMAILLLVTGLVTYIMIRYRAQPGRKAKLTFGDRRLEIAWTAGPILLLTFLFVLTLRTMSASDPVPHPPNADLIVTGYQWWWQIQYPHQGVITANEVHIPVGKKLLVKLIGGDVIHDFWVPQLTRKEDVIPGFPNEIWIEADDPGTYEGTCAEYCGAEHAWMRIRVIAESENQFNNWVQQQTQIPAAPTSQDAVQGSQLFQQLTCASCHAIAGTAAGQNIGPDLTHIASRQTIGAGVLNNTPATLMAWLHNPAYFKPESHMPDLKLNPDQIRSLTAYLETLR